MPKYRCSDGTMVEKSIIDRRVAKAKEQYIHDFHDEHGFLFCERSERSDLPLERSHIISVKYCQENGMTELSWSLDNLELLTREHHLKIESWPNQKRLDWYHSRKDGMKFHDFLTEYEGTPF